MLLELTDDNFEQEVVESDMPCFIEFTAKWCALCEELKPSLEELSEKYAGKIKFYTANTDENKGLRIKFAVAALPYMVYINNGEKSPLFDSAVPKEQIDERIQFMLDGGQAPTTTKL